MYGTVKPADINIAKDVEIFYYYRPTYNNDETNFNSFNSLDVQNLVQCKDNNGGIPISGLFNLKLPLNEFSKKGIYTIYIRPKEISATIQAVSQLTAFPDIRGVIFNSEELGNDFKHSNALVGYRIDYLDTDNTKKDFKIITSSNLALAQASNGGVSYILDNSGGFLFCTVTPSLSTTFTPNSLPFIGKQGDKVKLVNTKFNPIMIELEMVEHDDETISVMIEGNQLVDKDNAIITTFNNSGEIYHQSEYGAYKDSYGNPLYEFKKKKENIDNTQSFTNLEL